MPIRTLYIVTTLMLTAVITDGLIRGFTPLTAIGSAATALGLVIVAWRNA